MKIKAVVVCSKKWTKDGNTFNTVTLSVIGLGSMDFTVDERIIPDFVDGQAVSLELGIGISKNKPYVKPLWNTFTVEDVMN